jgi:hypothetical protein
MHLNVPVEAWRQIDQAPNYEVSDSGRVRRSTRGKRTRVGLIRKQYAKPNGYMLITLHVDGRRKGFQVHRLVARAFLGPSTLDVNHKNGDPGDNRLGNLEYMTELQNSHHAYWVINRGPHSERHHNAKLTENSIALLWSMRDAGKTSQEIGAALGCTPENVQHIVNGKGWVRVSARLGRLPLPD